jgi:hypothetical protein
VAVMKHIAIERAQAGRSITSLFSWSEILNRSVKPGFEQGRRGISYRHFCLCGSIASVPWHQCRLPILCRPVIS